MRTTILKEIDRLEFKHCKNCPLTNDDRYYEKYCIKNCEIENLKEQVSKSNKRASGYLSELHDALNRNEVLTKKLNHLHSYVFLTDEEVG